MPAPETLATFSIPETWVILGPYAEDDAAWTDQNGQVWLIHRDSLRYVCFRTSLKCACCGLVGDHFKLQHTGLSKDRPVYRAHFNLYAGEVLMTKDHKQPKSKGGSDHPDNLQTMCAGCNGFKDSKQNWQRGRLADGTAKPPTLTIVVPE